MNLRPATPDDAEAVAALWNTMIRDTLATFTTIEKTPQDIANLIQFRDGACLVIADPEVAGFATFGAFRGGPGYAMTVEHTVILDAHAQGRGQGRRLMTALMQAAALRGVHVMIAAISSANPAAAQFHAALGFTKTGHLPQVGYKNDCWLDLILMQKTLTPT